MDTLTVECHSCGNSYAGSEWQLDGIGWRYDGGNWYCPDCDPADEEKQGETE